MNFKPPELPERDSIPSPALVLDLDRIDANLGTMLRLAGTPERLRVHLKTHKLPQLIARCEAQGIHKHKCATIAEAEMAAHAGARDVLIAYPLVGPSLNRLTQLLDHYPNTTFRATVDAAPNVAELTHAAATARTGRPLPVLIDLDVGMGRTGIAACPEAIDLVRAIAQEPRLRFDGIHAYDGHIRDTDPVARTRALRGIELHVQSFRAELEAAGFPSTRVILGGTPTFPMHAAAEIPGLEASPGTCILHDAGYARAFPDLPFQPAAFLLTRVLSRPKPSRLTLDLGHKAVSGDLPLADRALVLGLPEAKIVGQSEEHLVIDSPAAADFPPGSALWAIPGHVCPTVALHAHVTVTSRNHPSEIWQVTARARRITI